MSESPLPLESSKGPSASLDAIAVLKHADTFMVCDRRGDIVGHHSDRLDELHSEGLFHDDTRLLSLYRLALDQRLPMLLSSHISRDNVLQVIDLAAVPDIVPGDPDSDKLELHLRRSRFLWQGSLREELRLRNFGRQARTVRLSLELGADFRDLFEVRGLRRGDRGTLLERELEEHALSLAYLGRDGTRRTIWIETSERAHIIGQTASFELELPAQGERYLFLSLGAARQSRRPLGRRDHRIAAATARREMRRKTRQGAAIRTSNALFNRWLERARADIALLLTELETGPYPYAGIPWFSTAFGRDAIITALQTLWLQPDIARGVLGYLAARQSTDFSTFTDAQPGKIQHETRKGEMAVLGEVPFLSYFGGVDTTPLFVMLAGAYFERTADLVLIKQIWPMIERALAWIDDHGDSDGDGFIEYQRGAETGLANQGWKDSHDSVFHADGRDAVGPIALCEVQAYVFAAKRAAADLADALGDAERGRQLRDQAEQLRVRFEAMFWHDGLGIYALALDGDKQPCWVKSSNLGHLLYCGIVAPDRAAAVAQHLLSTDSFTGWGIRTVATSEARYNPMSYHNGSVWPHDTAVAAFGLARYGFHHEAAQLLQALFEAAIGFDDERLPELFCGFRRHRDERPTAYPVACLPQAWASGAVYMLLQACLGITIDADQQTITIGSPALPAALTSLKVDQLGIAAREASISFVAAHGQVAVSLGGNDDQLHLELTSDLAIATDLRDALQSAGESP